MCKYTMEVTTYPENMDKVMDFIEAHLQEIENAKAARHLIIAGEELSLNVFSYAYNGNLGLFTLAISIHSDERRVTMEFRDSGREYNPLEKQDPDTSVDICERQIGGMGIMLSKKLTDEQSYSRVNGQNILTVTKKY